MPRLSASSAWDKALDLYSEAVRPGCDRPPAPGASSPPRPWACTAPPPTGCCFDLVARGWVLRVGEHYLPGGAAAAGVRRAAACGVAGRRWARPGAWHVAGRGHRDDGEPPGAGGRRLPGRRGGAARAAADDRDLRGQVLPVDRFAGPLALVAAWRRPRAAVPRGGADADASSPSSTAAPAGTLSNGGGTRSSSPR